MSSLTLRVGVQRGSRLGAALVLFAVALVAAPLVGLALLAFKGDAEIWPHLAAYVLPVALTQTTLLLAGVAIVTAAVGVGAAWLVTAFRFPGRNAFAWLLALPLALPTYIVAYIYVALLDAAGPAQSLVRTLGGWRSPNDYWFPEVRSLPGAILLMGLVLYPYVYLAARAMFQTQSAALIEVARTLGASRLRLLRHVMLPLARPALAVGLALVLLETLNDIGASEYLGVRTLTIAIFTTWLNRGSLPAAAQIACVMLVVIAGLIALERYGRRDRSFAASARRVRVVAPIVLTGWRRFAAFAACAVPVTFGFLLPVGFLSYETVSRGLFVGFDADLVRHAATSVAFAGIATALALTLGLALALVARSTARATKRSWIAAGLLIAGLGYAVPGTVLALGLMPSLVGVDEALNMVSRAVTGSSVGLVLAGSGGAIIIAYVIRFLAIAIGSAQAGLARIPFHLDAAARTLGASRGEITRGIHLPLLRPALGGAALLVFVDCVKELPATLLLRPLNVETLPTYIYQFATRGNFEEGALAALMIVAVGILPVILAVQYSELAFAQAQRSSASV